MIVCKNYHSRCAHHTGCDKDRQKQVGEEVEHLTLSHTAGGSVKWCRHLETLAELPKLSVHVWDLAIPLRAIYPTEIHTTIAGNLVQECVAPFAGKAPCVPNRRTGKCSVVVSCEGRTHSKENR